MSFAAIRGRIGQILRGVVGNIELACLHADLDSRFASRWRGGLGFAGNRMHGPFQSIHGRDEAARRLSPRRISAVARPAMFSDVASNAVL